MGFVSFAFGMIRWEQVPYLDAHWEAALGGVCHGAQYLMHTTMLMFFFFCHYFLC